MRHQLSPALICLTLLAASTACTNTPVSIYESQKPTTTWHKCFHNDELVGWSKETYQCNQHGERTLTMFAAEVSRRGQHIIRHTSEEQVRESPQGNFLSAKSTHTESSDKSTTTVEESWHVENDQLIYTSNDQASQTKQLFPLPKYTFSQVNGIIEACSKHQAGLSQFDVEMFDPTIHPQPFSFNFKRIAEESITIDDTIWDATHYNVCISTNPSFTIDWWVDQDFQVLRGAYQYGDLKVREDRCTAEIENTELVPPTRNLISNSIVPCNPAIHNPRYLYSAIYQLNYDSEVEFTPPQGRYQRLLRSKPGEARVVVNLSMVALKNETAPGPEALQTSRMLDHQDPAILALAKQINPRGRKPRHTANLANKACLHINSFLSGNYDTASSYDSASQVARNKRGDCSEHAVLLCAVLRALDIPARCAIGLSYTGEHGFEGHKDVFCYHMWTQAWVTDSRNNGHWVDLDPTWGWISATHILLETGYLNDNDPSIGLKYSPFIQNGKVKVIATQY